MTGGARNHRLLSEAQRKRIKVKFTDPYREACRGRSDFVFGDEKFRGNDPPETHAPGVWTRKAYGNTIASLYGGANPAFLGRLHVDRSREKYRSLTQGAPAARAPYDVRFDAARGALTYARAPCVPADVDRVVRFFLHVVPVDPDDLPDDQVRYGFHHLDFNLPAQALFDGKCLVTIRLPEYAVDHVRTGQTERKDGVWTALWEETFTPGRAPTRAGSQRRSSATDGPRRR